MHIFFGINELSIDSDFVTRPSDASFEHIAHAQLATNLLRVDRFVPICEGGVARDDEAVLHPRQIGRQILGDPVRKILLAGVIAEIGKGQHDDRQARRGEGRRDRSSDRSGLCWRPSPPRADAEDEHCSDYCSDCWGEDRGKTPGGAYP